MAESALNIEPEVSAAQNTLHIVAEHAAEGVARIDQAGRTVQEQIDSIEAEIKALIDGDGKNPSMEVLQQRYDTAEQNYAKAVNKAINREAKKLNKGLRELDYKGDLDAIEGRFKLNVNEVNRIGNSKIKVSKMAGYLGVRQAYNKYGPEEKHWETPKEAEALRDNALNVVNLQHERDLKGLGEKVQNEIQRSVDRVHSNYPRVKQKASKLVGIAEPLRERIVAIAEKQAELPALYEQLEIVNDATVKFVDSLPVATAEPELFPGVDPELLNYGQDWKEKFSISAGNDNEELEPLEAFNLVSTDSITDNKRFAWAAPVLVVDNTSETEEVVAEDENEAAASADLEQPAEAALNEEPSAEETSLDQPENDATETSVPVAHSEEAPADESPKSLKEAVNERAEQLKTENGVEHDEVARAMAINDIKKEQAEAGTGEATAADAPQEPIVSDETAQEVAVHIGKLEDAVESAGEAPQIANLEEAHAAHPNGKIDVAGPEGVSDRGMAVLNAFEGNAADAKQTDSPEEQGPVIEGTATEVVPVDADGSSVERTDSENFILANVQQLLRDNGFNDVEMGAEDEAAILVQAEKIRAADMKGETGQPVDYALAQNIAAHIIAVQHAIANQVAAASEASKPTEDALEADNA